MKTRAELTDRRNLIERCVRYMGKVQCKYCDTEIYHDEDEARELVEEWIEHDGLTDIDDLRGLITNICDGCEHILSKGN